MDTTRRMRRAVKYVKRGKRILKFVKSLPGFDIAPNGEFHYRGGQYARDNGLPDPMGPGLSLLFYPITKPIEIAVNRLPPFRKPKRTFRKLPKGLNQRELKL